MSPQILIPRNQHQAEELFAKSLARGYLSEKRYPAVSDLFAKYQKHDALMVQHHRKMIDHMVEAGKALFAIRQRVPHGSWAAWLEEHDLHYKKAERLIGVAIWWNFFPELNPNTEGPWSLSAAYEALPKVKDAVWEKHGKDDTVEFGDLETPEDLTVTLPPNAGSRGAKVAMSTKRKLQQRAKRFIDGIRLDSYEDTPAALSAIDDTIRMLEALGEELGNDTE